VSRPAAIILCGGRGARLWPVSRASRPKYLIDLGDRGTLLSMTVQRTLRAVDADRVVVVTAEEHRSATAKIAGELGVHTIVTEPSPRDTTAAAVLGVREVERLWGASRVVSLPADHEVEDLAGWEQSIRRALAAPADIIATIGIRPTRPSVDYGYIETESGDGERLHVARFHEKPDVAMAESYLETGRYLWNTAMMAFTTHGFLNALSLTSHDVIDAVDAASISGTVDAGRWTRVRSVALEHSLMEPAAAAGLVDVVPADFGWRDLGSWGELAPMLPQAADVVSTVPGTQVVVTSGAPARRYVNAGIPGLIVVDTGDVLLVTTDREASTLKKAVALAENAGWQDTL
jgi:mannose-1-phosphate guanylyltransferase